VKRNNEKEDHKQTFRLALVFTTIVFVTILITLLVVGGFTYLFMRMGWIRTENLLRVPHLLFMAVSLAVGTVLAFVISRRPLKPLQEIMDATDKIASGDYSVRVQPNGIESFRELGERFNHMAEELSSVEMLRSDFVNNFSHEFKTPIVSIRGFAKALKWDELLPEEREEYLDIIISESQRLADLSNSVLYLSKIEKQTIVTDVSRINISEQIRQVVALLYKKLSEKNISVIFDADEKYLACNEELVRQVWLNLLDNAIKFSPNDGKITIRIAEFNSNIIVTVADEGPGVSAEMQKHIFDKFYQGENSHTQMGNGLGLAIVRRIVELHGGSVKVSSDGKKGSVFTVELMGQQY